ncbi:MAG: DNA-3-methyladenine glycosylase [Chloroflexota bacterium]|nr:DNA-3-methyladenine glycosylase [Chloroflexota bacterium]
MTATNPHAAAIAHLTAVDETLARIIARHSPCTLTLEPDLFGSVARAIVGQQISVHAAAAVLSRVRALMPDGTLTPAATLAVPGEHLRAAGLSWRKVGYLKDCAARFTDGSIDPIALADADDETFIAALLPIEGVGRWTAEMVLIFALGRPDILSTGDYGLRSAMQRHWNLPAPATPQEMERIAARWRPYRSVASWYLWRSLSNVPDSNAN